MKKMKRSFKWNQNEEYLGRRKISYLRRKEQISLSLEEGGNAEMEEKMKIEKKEEREKNLKAS